jgi:hypothetical protein
MKAPEIAAGALMAIVCAFFGWLLLFKTESVVTWARGVYVKSRFHGPFAGVVQKNWYPTYLRCMGAVIWLFDAALISMFYPNGDA